MTGPRPNLLIRGLVAYPITPADESGVVDAPALGALVRRLADAGVDRVCVLGSTGTYPYLSRKERRRAIETAVEAAAGRTPVMAGIGALRTDEAEALAGDARAAGADAGLLAPVSYAPLTDDEVAAHFETVARTGLPICIYNNPVTTHFTFSLDLIERLAKTQGIVAAKNPAPPAAIAADHVHDLRRRTPEGFSVGYSVDSAAAEALIAGGDAWHSVLGGLFPTAALAITCAAMSGDAAEARRLNEALAPLWRLAAELSSLRLVYAAVNRLGLARCAPPRPILPLPPEAEARVIAVIESCGLD